MSNNSHSAPKGDFSDELYQEHLEEASFLYEQRLGLYDDPEITWLDINDFELRLEAHIDALVIGENPALAVCKQQAKEGDFGEAHGAVQVFCRHKRLDLVQEIIDAIASDDAEGIKAISDALKHELPLGGNVEIIKLLSQGGDKDITIAAQVAGYKRLPADGPILGALRKGTEDSLPALLWALGRIGEKSPPAPLLEYLNLKAGEKEERISQAAALTLLRLGNRQAIKSCISSSQTQNWPLLPLGAGAGPSSVPVLRKIAGERKDCPDCLTALGLQGDIIAVDTLLTRLNKPKLARAASIALNLITGAEIYEDIFVPEEIEADELFDEEREQLEKGESLYPPGEHSGTTINMLSQNPELWEHWWQENRSRFDYETRYRNGKPYSPACLLENLKNERSPRLVRQLAYEELVIRYSIDFPFETDMPVGQQKKILAQYEESIQANQGRFKEGTWYFAGELIEE